ncbi:M28 family peptidase [Myxococcota bacterium]|nr:M28 family peptidase [Myxococcota bacterium]
MSGLTCLLLAALLPILACTDDDPGDDTGDPGASPPLADLLDQDALWGRLVALEALATEHGDRLATSAGEAAALDLLRAELQSLGWSVQTQEITWGVPLRTASNLVATSPFGGAAQDPSAPVLLLGAHLDGVRDCAAINDNGTGVAAVLELAQGLSLLDPAPEVSVRVLLFTHEEWGRVGSYRYVQSLDPAQADAIVAFLNVDMLGSKNGFPLVMDGGDLGGEGAEGSEALTEALGQALADAGQPWELLDASTSVDTWAFMDLGIPLAWVFAGGSEDKTEEQAQAWGGTADVPYDVCYHTACDDLDNVDMELVMVLTRAVATVTEGLLQAAAVGGG